MTASVPSFPRRVRNRLKILLMRMPLGYCVTVLMTILYKILLDISYLDILAPNYAYAGFSLKFSFGSVLFSYLLLFCVVFWIPKEYRSPSDFLFFFLLIMAYIPVLTVYAFGGENLYYTVLHTLFWILCGIAIRFFPTISFPQVRKKTAKGIMYGFSPFLVYTVFWPYGKILGCPLPSASATCMNSGPPIKPPPFLLLGISSIGAAMWSSPA